MPAFEEFGPVYESLLELAEEHLDSPVQTRIETWEDGEFKIRVFHGYAPQEDGQRLRSVLRYHSAEDAVVGALLEVDEDGEETLIFREDVAELGAVTPRP